MSKHPCFDKGAHAHFGRMHLPVAPACNIQCGFCDRRYSCANESRPGVTSKVLAPQEACDLAKRACAQMPNLSVAGIAGPGDPLANPDETLETLRLVHNALPHLLLCLSTNGLNLPLYIDDLANLGVRHLTVTINAADPDIGAQIYQYINTPKARLTGSEGAACLLERQLAGIATAKAFGMTIKVNMVIVKDINDQHAEAVAKKAAKAGADLMNCIAMAPSAGARLGHLPEPSAKVMALARTEAEKYLPQMRHCSRCRADALGLLGEKFTFEDLNKARARRFC